MNRPNAFRSSQARRLPQAVGKGWREKTFKEEVVVPTNENGFRLIEVVQGPTTDLGREREV